MSFLKTAERVSSFEPSDKMLHYRHLVAYDQASRIISGKVLEIGCGEGYALPLLLPKAQEYIALDKDDMCRPIRKSLLAAGMEFENLRLYFYRQKVPHLDSFPDKCMDYIVSFQVIEHIFDDALFLREIYRVLKPGGKLILTTPNRKMSLTRNPYHCREYDAEGLTRLCGTYFKEIDLLGIKGTGKAMIYYEANKRSVAKIVRFDLLNLQRLLPAMFLKLPYTILNRYNRKKLSRENDQLLCRLQVGDFFLDKQAEGALDFFVIATKC